jgi:hypothetical protein
MSRARSDDSRVQAIEWNRVASGNFAMPKKRRCEVIKNYLGDEQRSPVTAADIPPGEEGRQVRRRRWGGSRASYTWSPLKAHMISAPLLWIRSSLKSSAQVRLSAKLHTRHRRPQTIRSK